MNNLLKKLYPFSLPLGKTAPLTTPLLRPSLNRSFDSAQLREDLSNRGSFGTTTRRASISTIKELPQQSQTALTDLPPGAFEKKKKVPDEEGLFARLTREQHASMCLEAALKGMNITVHAHPVGSSNSIDPVPLSALISPVGQYSVLEAKRVFPNAPKGEAFGPYVSKLCEAYLKDDPTSLDGQEQKDLEHFSSRVQSLAASLKAGHSYLEKLQKVIEPNQLGLDRHHAVPPMGIIPVNGTAEGYGGPESLGDAALPFFLAVCKAMRDSQHPVGLRVDTRKDSTAFKSFLDSALKGAQEFNVPVTISTDWSRLDRRVSEADDAERIRANLDRIRTLITARETEGSKVTSPPLRLLLNASELDKEKPLVKKVYEDFAQDYKPWAFSHNTHEVGKENPLFERMMETGTVEDPKRSSLDVSMRKLMVEASIQAGIEKAGPFPDTFNV